VLLGIGEGIEDLINFRAVDFVKAFFSEEQKDKEDAE
jgi:signal recognition particle GTPase